MKRNSQQDQLQVRKIVDDIDRNNQILFNAVDMAYGSRLEQTLDNRKKAESIGYKEGIVDCYLAEARIAYQIRDTDRQKECHVEALDLAENISYQKGIGWAKCEIGWWMYLNSESYDRALQYASEALSTAREEDLLELQWYSLCLLSVLIATLGDIVRGYERFQEALTLAETHFELTYIFKTLLFCSTSFHVAPELYEEHLKRAVMLMEEAKAGTMVRVTALVNYASALAMLHKHDEHLQYLNQALILLPALPGKQQGQVRANIGSQYHQIGKMDNAKIEFERALDLGLGPGEARCAYCELGQMHMYSNPQKALEYFEKSLDFSANYMSWQDANCNHGYLAELYQSLGNIKKAAEHYNLYRKITKESVKKEEVLRADYAGVLHRYDASQKHERQLAEEVEAKSAALTEKAMLLAEQTEFMANFRDDMRTILRRVEAQDPAINDIRKKLRELPEAVNWKEFDEQFQSVHPQFSKQLEEKYPDLTKMERKLCVLFRLNLNSRDVSKLLSLSKRTIEHHRYRIRKKFKLDPDDDIARFLGQI